MVRTNLPKKVRVSARGDVGESSGVGSGSARLVSPAGSGVSEASGAGVSNLSGAPVLLCAWCHPGSVTVAGHNICPDCAAKEMARYLDEVRRERR